MDNLLIFLILMVFYHVAYISGYCLSINNFQFKSKAGLSKSKYKKTHIQLLIFVSILAFLIGHKNLTMSEELIPLSFFDDFISGVNNSSLVYADRMQRIDEYSGSKILNVLYFFVAFAKVVLIPTVVFYWRNLSVSYKFTLITISLLTVMSGVAAGVNKLLFDFVILYSSSSVLLIVYNYYQNKFFLKKKVVFLFLIAIVSLFLALWFFSEAMLGRGGSPTYIESTSPLGHIKVNPEYITSDSDSIISYLYVYLSYYIVQGYYGFSQALNIDFVWTYGLGNSEFISRQMFWLFGYDPSLDTFQHRVDSVWGEKAQWHSFYTHLANDFHFIGVIFVNFLLGFYLAALWKSFIYENNFYAKYLLPLFVIMIIFTPANNQIFGFLETFSAFFLLTILWVRSVRIKKLSKN